MKGFILNFLMCVLAVSLSAQEYVDLGLPSGVLWKSKNERFCTAPQAEEMYGESLPTMDLYRELLTFCKWEEAEEGYWVTGPNNTSIFFPIVGIINKEGECVEKDTKSAYWTSHHAQIGHGSVEALTLEHGKYPTPFYYFGANYSFCVRLIRLPQPSTNYVDLGLPSGTKWCDRNEYPIFYAYDDAMQEFGNRLPTKEQWEELEKKCQWTWTDKGYRVTGPNGNSIFLPAVGIRNGCGMYAEIGYKAVYLSSTPYTYSNPGEYVITTDITQYEHRIIGYPRTAVHCVRLVSR